jgi:Fe-S cluster biogenesis protein NfuA
VDTPHSHDGSVASRVQDALDGIRPALQMDGGDCELVEVFPDGTAKILLKGACTGCPASSMTVTMGIERRLKASVPEITRVVAV